jgi:hypothetical protein
MQTVDVVVLGILALPAVDMLLLQCMYRVSSKLLAVLAAADAALRRAS